MSINERVGDGGAGGGDGGDVVDDGGECGAGAASERMDSDRKDQHARARRYAAAVLGQRVCSTKKLIERMVRKGFDEDIARQVADRFVEVGVLDDAALAASMARSEIARKPAGAFLIEMKLVAKGIDRAIAKEAAAQATADRDLVEDATSLAIRRLATMGERVDETARRRRVYAALARRGFSSDVCRTAVERAMKGQADLDEME